MSRDADPLEAAADEVPGCSECAASSLLSVLPRRTRRFPSTDASVKEERRTSRSTEGRRLSGLFGGIEESEAATAAASARFLSRRGRTCPHTPAVKRRRSHLPASLVPRRGEHDGEHEFVQDLLGGANVGLVVDLLLLKQSESSVARSSRTSHSEAPLLRQDLLDDVLERDHPNAARLAVGELALARDRLPGQLRVARDEGHVRVALLEGVEEREERVLRPNLLRAVG
mmetsp:Transcript_3615/g.10579  ORF Transcript_3615/g.10579 Transcript_3615/m.10579 type:complete len:228 (+) Transcript_3615:372-1055(+)